MARVVCLLVANAVTLIGVVGAPSSNSARLTLVRRPVTATHGRMPGACPSFSTQPVFPLNPRVVRVAAGARAEVLDAPVHRLLIVNAPSPAAPDYGPHPSVSVLDTATGRVLATRPLGPAAWDAVASPQAIAVDERTHRAFVLVEPASVSRIYGYVGTGPPVAATGAVDVLDATTGATLRTVPLGRYAVAVAVDAARGRAFVLTADTIARTGAYGPIRPVGLGRVAVLDAATGEVQGVVAVGLAPSALAVDARTGRAFAAVKGPYGPMSTGSGASHLRYIGPLGPGAVVALDAARMAVVTTATVGLSPIALAPDADTGRVFAVNGGPGYEAPYDDGSTYPAYNPGYPNRTSVSVLDATAGTRLHVMRTDKLPNLGRALVVASRANRVFVETRAEPIMLDATSGAPTGSVSAASPVGDITGDLANVLLLAVDERRGLVVLANQPDTRQLIYPSYAFVADARRGAGQAVVQLGYGPEGAAIDERTGRAYVLSGSASCPYDDYPGPIPGSVTIFSVTAP